MKISNPIYVQVRCPFCDTEYFVEVPYDGFEKWQFQKMPIQRAMPQLSARDRESLISGICSTCWNNLFIYNDDDDD